MSNIGAWYNVLYAMMVLSMLTNSLIVGFSSEQLAVWCPWMYETIDNDQFIISGYGRYHKLWHFVTQIDGNAITSPTLIIYYKGI